MTQPDDLTTLQEMRDNLAEHLKTYRDGACPSGEDDDESARRGARLSDAHRWEIEHHLAHLKSLGHQDFPLIQALEAMLDRSQPVGAATSDRPQPVEETRTLAQIEQALDEFDRLTLMRCDKCSGNGGIETYVTRSDAQSVLLLLRARLRVDALRAVEPTPDKETPTKPAV